MTMHQKNEHVDFFGIYVQKGQFWNNSSLTIFLSSLAFILSSQKNH